MLHAVAAHWFRARRGIRPETLEAFGVSSGETEDTVLFPYPNGTKVRRGWEAADRKFWWDPPIGNNLELFVPPDYGEGPRPRYVLTEGETDTMILWQELGPERRQNLGVLGLSGLSAWRDHYVGAFGDAETVYVVLDNDTGYQAMKQGDEVWKQIRRALGPRARRVQLPQGIKDVAEFFQHYDVAAFGEILRQSAATQWNYPALDLSIEVPEYDWLVDPLIAKGDVAVLYGPPGLGKSWVTMSLALAVAGGGGEWLGMPVSDGPVLYVDEENPQDVVRRRLHKLGYQSGKHGDSLRYLWYAGVRLDAEPERFFEDAEAIGPSLIILDSLSRIHSKNENSAEEMNPLFTDGIIPLSRRLGATVLLPHHTPHTTEGKSRARGSSVIGAASDINIALRPLEVGKGVDTGAAVLVPEKLRRTPRFGTQLAFRVRDQGSGRTRLERLEEEPY